MCLTCIVAIFGQVCFGQCSCFLGTLSSLDIFRSDWSASSPPYTLAMSCDPELAIARARANQDHDLVITYPDHWFSQNNSIDQKCGFLKMICRKKGVGPGPSLHGSGPGPAQAQAWA